jgi:histone H3/H4
MDIFAQIAEKIIKEQEVIIGPVAFEQAKKVSGMEVSDAGNVKISGNAKEVLTHLVEQYEKLFGRTSVEVCREAVRSIKSQLSKDDLPVILQ